MTRERVSVWYCTRCREKYDQSTDTVPLSTCTDGKLCQLFWYGWRFDRATKGTT